LGAYADLKERKRLVPFLITERIEEKENQKSLHLSYLQIDEAMRYSVLALL
jgi:hypothetical protein